jgi:uncharacterized protein (TIGR03067 family)
MKNTRWLYVAATIALLLPAAWLVWHFSGWRIDPSADSRRDLQALQGTWKVVTFAMSGDEKLKGWMQSKAVGTEVRINDDCILIGEGEEEPHLIRLGANGSLKSIDLSMWDATYYGIYEFSDSTLKVCIANKSEAARPSTIGPVPGEDWTYVELKKRRFQQGR